MNAPRRTQDERREATRDALLTAAVALIAERGIEAATLADVAERAGVTKGALVHHFENKETLLDAALDRVGAHLTQVLTAAWDPTAPPYPRLRKALAALVDVGEARDREVRALVALATQGGYDPRLGALVRARIEALERVFCDGFSLTLAELNAQPRVPVEALARALVASVMGAALRPGEALADGRDARRLWESAIVAMIDPFVVEAP